MSLDEHDHLCPVCGREWGVGIRHSSCDVAQMKKSDLAVLIARAEKAEQRAAELARQNDEMAEILLRDGYAYEMCTMGRFCSNHRQHWTKSIPSKDGCP